MISAPTIMNCRCSTVAERTVQPKNSGVARMTIGKPQIKAAPKNEPIRLPSPPMITMNRIRKDSLMLKESASAAPSQRNTISAPATPQ